MEIRLTLALPRDELSVPVVRRVLKASMQALGVRADVLADLELALTEACTNVLDHARSDQEYEVTAGTDGSVCVIEVRDRAGGLAADRGDRLGRADADLSAESGRGIQLMRAAMDRVEFDRKLEDGTVVRLQKALELVDGAPIRLLTGESTPERR